MKYIAVGVVAVIVLAAVGFYVLNQGDGGDKVKITQKGSDTMLELCQIWAEDYMIENDNAVVEISGGGSSTGITALINGQVDVAQASRQIKASEIASAEAAGFTPMEFRVAIDGIAIIVHTGNAVDTLTVEQLRGIYNGTYTNWNQVGGADRAITLYGRQSTSGTYEFFWEHVLKKENYSSSMNMLSGNSAIVAAVQGDQGGVGYVGIGYAGSSGINVLDLKKNSTSEAYSPLDGDAVQSGEYDLARYLYLYTHGEPNEAVKDWLSWILHADLGQKVAEEIGFYALSADVIAEEMAKLD